MTTTSINTTTDFLEPAEQTSAVSQMLKRWVEEQALRGGSYVPSDALDSFEAVLAAGAADPDDIARWWAVTLGLPMWETKTDLAPAVAFAEKVPFEFAIDHLVLVVGAATTSSCDAGESYQCVTARPWHWQALDCLATHLDGPLRFSIAPESLMRDLIGQVYDQLMAQSRAVMSATADSSEARDAQTPSVRDALLELDDRELLATAGKEPVARLVDALLYEAVRRRASDVHVHPYPENLKVRFRLDGVLHDAHVLPRHLQEQVLGRIKVLAGMDVAEKRLAQDGRTSVHIASRQIDLRVSTLPTTCGERIVVRLLEQTVELRQLDQLGMPAEIELAFREAINRSTGLILVTGPTGSGKTTTLYSALAQLNATAKNILTLEDPVEYRLAGISQVQISDKKGMTFVSGLRHILRQDPDIIMVGEIRDEPTARMVIQSSLTGHLVLSTLHTNSAAGAMARLMELGIEPYLLASSLLGVLAQRLVRKRCATCNGVVDRMCTTCNGTGYRGRIALFEWLNVTPVIRRHILAGASAEQLQAAAESEGIELLPQQGALAVLSGVTTQEELLRVFGNGDASRQAVEQ